MLRGQITFMNVQDVFDTLLYGIDQEIITLIQRNGRMIEEGMLDVSLSAEQKELVRYIVRNPERLAMLAVFVRTGSKQEHETAKQYVADADLEWRGK